MAPARLALFYWRPSDPGPFAGLFDRLEAEFDHFAEFMSDQPVTLMRQSTIELLDEWFRADQSLVSHAEALAARYDVALTIA